MKILTVFIVCYVNILISCVVCIGLDEYEAGEINYISSIAVHKSKAFLALPRSACFNKKSEPTVVETHWDEGKGYIFSRFFHQIAKPKIQSFQEWGDCTSIQDAVHLSMEPLIPKLWILDKGSDDCSPKLLSYNTVFNRIIDTVELKNIERRNLNTMVIDPVFDDHFGHRAYIGQAEENVLLIFSLKKMIWWKVRLVVTSCHFKLVNPYYLTISKTSSDLFISGNEGTDVFSLNLEQLNGIDELEIKRRDDLMTLNVTFRGEKLELSTGIETDLDSGLVYFMKRYNAILRWNTGFPPVAEHHVVLVQSSEKFPDVSGFFTDHEESIWAIVNPFSLNDCNKVTKNSTTSVMAKNRAIRIMKYSKSNEEIGIDDDLQDK